MIKIFRPLAWITVFTGLMTGIGLLLVTVSKINAPTGQLVVLSGDNLLFPSILRFDLRRGEALFGDWAWYEFSEQRTYSNVSCATNGSKFAILPGPYVTQRESGTSQRLEHNQSINEIALATDGRRVAFSGGGLSIVDTGNHDLTPMLISNEFVRDLAWSPTDNSIVFVSYTIDANSVYTYHLNVIEVESQRKRQIFESNDYIYDVAWSPIDQRIVFARVEQNGIINLYSITGNGLNLTRLTSRAGNNVSPVWSPEGEWIVFSSDRRSSNFRLYIMRPDGSAQTPLYPDRFFRGGFDQFAECWLRHIS